MSNERTPGTQGDSEAKAPVSGSEPRPALTLSELLELLVQGGTLTPNQAREIESREVTLRSRVLKERVGSVRSQAARRYSSSPAEIVSAASLAHPTRSGRRLDEDHIAEALAEVGSLPYVKIDPLRLDSDLITKMLSRPFVRRHVVIPLVREDDRIRVAITDPFDSMLREMLESSIREPLTYSIASKRDILAIIDRVYGFRSSITKAQSELGDSSPTAIRSCRASI